VAVKTPPQIVLLDKKRKTVAIKKLICGNFLITTI